MFRVATLTTDDLLVGDWRPLDNPGESMAIARHPEHYCQTMQ